MYIMVPAFVLCGIVCCVTHFNVQGDGQKSTDASAVQVSDTTKKIAAMQPVT